MKTKLTLLMLLLFSVVIFSQTFTVDGLNYSVTSTNPNEVSLRGGTPATLDLVIPETVTDASITYTVVTIQSEALRGKGLTTITIPDSVTTIENNAFTTNNLTSVDLGEGVVTIGGDAFRDNALTTITIPDSVTIIGNSAFRRNDLISITLGSGLITIGELVFIQNSSLESIVVKASTPPSIGANAISGIQNIDLTVPQNTELAYIFNSWSGFGSINGEDEDFFKEFEVDNITYVVTSFAPNEVELTGGTSILQDLIIETLVSNGDNDFTVTSIGANAIDGSLLTSITITATTPPMAVANAFGDNSAVALTISDGTEVAYLTAGWTGFYSVNGVVDFEVGDTFTENNFNYEVTSLNPNEVAITGGTTVSPNLIIVENVSNGGLDFVVTAIGDSAFISSSLTSVTFPNTIRTIGFQSFESNNLTSLILPENVVSIGQLAFNGSNFNSITSLNPTPPSVFLGTNDDSFNNEQNIDLTIPPDTEADYEAAGWVGFNSVNGVLNFEVGDTFTENNFNYEVISITPNEVAITGGTTTLQDLIIPEKASSSGSDFVVTAIGDAAFDGAGLTSVIFPNTIRTLGASSFRSNSITEVVIPEGVTVIPDRCFFSNDLVSISLPQSLIAIEFRGLERNDLESITLPKNVNSISGLGLGNNPLTEIISLNSDGPNITLGSSNSNSNSFDNEQNIDLYIPANATQSYTDAGWTGFKSVTEVSSDIVLAPKVFLQGAATNPNTGEEALMRDDLRVAGLLPTTSPYVDGLTADATVFDTEGNDAIVDWVFVVLVDATDGSTVIASTSALLQRDGDVVTTDGISPLSITADSASYYIAIHHRNHLGILSANAMTLSTATTTLDFTTDSSLIQGGAIAVNSTDTGFIGIISGDFDENGQITNTDVNATIPLLGQSGYNNADLNLDGQITNAEINTLLTPNIGKGEQFSTTETEE